MEYGCEKCGFGNPDARRSQEAALVDAAMAEQSKGNLFNTQV